MNTYIRDIGAALAVLCLTSSVAMADVDLEAELASGKTLIEVAEEAKKDGMEPAETTSALMDLGQTGARSSYAVTRAWANCDATRSSVYTATRRAPDEAESIVTSISGFQDCGCSTSDNWASGRLEQRIRLPGFTYPVDLTATCTCVAIAVQSAISAAPDRSDAIVKAAVNAGAGLGGYVADSVGDRDYDEVPELANAGASGGPGVFRRIPELCETDTDDVDEFRVDDQWRRSPGDDFSDLGSHATKCDEDEDSEPNINELMISEFRTDANGGGYVEIYNRTGDTVDLRAEDYRLSLHFQGVEQTALDLSLSGVISNDQTYVVAGSSAPEEVLARANQVVYALSPIDGDAMVLHPGPQTDTCECAEVVVAAALSTDVPEDVAEMDGPATSRMIKAKIDRLYGGVENVQAGFVVDSIGRVDYEDDEMDEEPLPPLLRRETVACDGDANELNTFDPTGRWLAFGEPAHEDAGLYSPSCRSANIDLVLSEHIDGMDDQDVVEIHNPTPADVDLAGGGYVLEVYQPGSASPEKVIRLEGDIASRSSFLLADDDSEEALDRDPDMKVSDLELTGSSAVILRKLIAPRSLSCMSPVALAANTLEPDYIFFLTPPQSPGDPLNPPAPPPLDPIASPN